MGTVHLSGVGTLSEAASPETATKPALAFDVRDLTKVYHMGETDVHALRGVTAAIPEGEFAVLLGPSGSGKSTFLNIIGGLDHPTSGSVKFFEIDLLALGDDALTEYRRNNVGFIFQFYNLMPSLTARENVQLVTEISDDPMDPVAALEIVGLGDRADHFPSQLSGGEQQRVAIARAVAKRPRVLLCDEPTGALDRETGVLVLEALQRANEDLGTTTLIITHNAASAGLGDRVLHFADGVIQQVDLNETRMRAHEIEW